MIERTCLDLLTILIFACDCDMSRKGPRQKLLDGYTTGDWLDDTLIIGLEKGINALFITVTSSPFI
ncbi:hypothetical protein MY3296_008078 [Beauveria thailandica]